MKIIHLVLVFLLMGNIVNAQQIPLLTGETLDNHKMTLPAGLKGKYSLVCFASSQKAQADLESWLDPVYQRFIAKTGLMDDMYDVNVLFIPVMTGKNAAFAPTVKKRFRDSAQEDLKAHVFFIDGDNAASLASLEILGSDDPHFFLLNPEGNIIYKTKGRFTDEKFDAIDELIE